MPSFFISHDDAVWTLRVRGDLQAQLARLLRAPEVFLGEATHAVDRAPLVTSLWNAARGPEAALPVYRTILRDPALRSRLARYVREHPSLTPAQFEKYVAGLDLTPAKCFLFDPGQSVLVSVQYGTVSDLRAAGNRLRVTPAEDELLVQGEYGTNVVRVFAPVLPDAPELSLPLHAPIQLTLTATNVAFIHFDLASGGADLIESVAALALHPPAIASYLNRQWRAGSAAEIVPHPDFVDALRPYADSAYGSFANFESALRAKLQFRIAETAPDRQSHYEFLYQAPAGVRAASTTSVSSCVKIAATLSPGQLEQLADQGYFWVTLQSGQMVRWMIP